MAHDTSTDGSQVRLLRLRAVLDLVGLSRSTVYALCAEDRFPKPHRIAGLNAALWDSRDVDRWIHDQLADA